MKIFRLLATSLLVALSMGVSSCNNEVKSSDLEDRVDENGKYIVYKKGDNNPFTGISIPTKNPNMKVFYESGVIVKKEQVTNNGYKRLLPTMQMELLNKTIQHIMMQTEMFVHKKIF